VARILVVEDDPDVRQILSEYLRSSGHAIVCATSAELARNLLATEAIELASIDCLMSGEQGNSLAEHASQLGIPVILTSGDPHYLEMLAEGPFPFLAKPFRLTALEGLIRGTRAPTPA
jgi:DNA-binding NtrC family response regulator